MQLKFENQFSISENIRVYDYAPEDVKGKQVYIEGVILRTEDFPVKAFIVACNFCTGNFRAGKEITVPMELACHEFDNRIVKAKFGA